MARKSQSSSSPAAQPVSRWLDVADACRPLADIFRSPGNRLAALSVFTAYALVAALTEQLNPERAPWLWLLSGGTLLMWLTWIDLRTQHLPNVLVALLAVVGALALGRTVDPLNGLAGLVAGLALFGGLSWAFLYLRGIPGLGLGDVKLLGALGLWVGVSGLPLLLLVASLSAFGMVVLQWRQGRHGEHFAFGPFLCFGGWIVIGLQPQLWLALAGVLA